MTAPGDIPTVTFSERVLPFIDEDGSMYEIDALVGEIDAMEELGCIVVYHVEIDPPVPPERMEILKSLVGAACIQELNKARAAR